MGWVGLLSVAYLVAPCRIASHRREEARDKAKVTSELARHLSLRQVVVSEEWRANALRQSFPARLSHPLDVTLVRRAHVITVPPPGSCSFWAARALLDCVTAHHYRLPLALAYEDKSTCLLAGSGRPLADVLVRIRRGVVPVDTLFCQ